MYIPKDIDEMKKILEALRTFSSLQGMDGLTELLGDAEITLAMEEIKSDQQQSGVVVSDKPVSR